MRSRVCPLGGFVLALLAAGCSGPKLYPVTGKVAFPDGTPFTGGSVYFDPVDPKASPAGAEGAVRPDGTFVLRSGGLGDGAYPGRYRACLLLPAAGDDDPKRRVDLSVPRKYTDPRTSGFEFTVEERPNEFTLTVEANPKAKGKAGG